jgi:hypothetical protein
MSAKVSEEHLWLWCHTAVSKRVLCPIVPSPSSISRSGERPKPGAGDLRVVDRLVARVGFEPTTFGL